VSQAVFIMQRILPRGLYWRAALILIVPIVTIQLVFSSEFIQRFYEDVTDQMTQGVAIDLGFLMDEIAASATLEEAQTRVAPLAEALEIMLAIPADADFPLADRMAFIDLSGGQIISTLRKELPALAAVDLTDESRRVRLRLDSHLGPIGATVSRSRMSARNPHQLLVLMVLTSVLMTVIAYFFLRRQLRPITKLAEAAEEFGKGRTVSYKPRGAQEVRAAGRAFLDMRGRIERQIEQRTLMLSGVSHDLRTPLTRMRLALSLMPEDPEVAALQEDVAQMERMVDEFLAFVRGDAMEGSEPTDAVALVRGIVERSGLGVRLSGVIGDAAPVEMRPQAVSRAVENLISNARRYGSVVEVDLEFRNGSLRIAVEDDGPGIAEDRRDEALRPFTRLEGARDPNRGGGVGLGLSIASDIALSHGGALRLGRSEHLGGLKAELSLAR
jgi:two-component system osmolarity sensor histidine kinase EnvZ